MLLEVADVGSIHGAARRLGIARSALRRRLADLEAETGCELFSANASGVVLTRSGAILADEGRALLARSARMLAAAQAAKERPEGVLRIISPVGVPDLAHVSLVRVLCEMHPGVRVHEVEAAEPHAHLHSPFDLMLHFGPPPSHGEWYSRILKRVRLVPIASEAYFAAHGRPASPADLSRHRILGWRRPGADPAVWPLLDGGTVTVEPLVVSDNGQFVHRAAQEGVGILLGNPEGAFLEGPTQLVPTLDDVIGVEETIRVLSPVPASSDPRVVAVLAGIHALLDGIAS